MMRSILCFWLVALSLPALAVDSDSLRAAKHIDDLIAHYHKQESVTPTPVAGDEVFLRRTFLMLIGRIPTYQEAIKFLNDRSQDKRQRLVDSLLNHPGYVNHFYNYWADVLRINRGKLRGVVALDYANWVRDQLSRNTPYDKFVYKLLTAEGNSRDNGAVGYYFRDENMIMDTTSTTLQVFMGTQMGCAQCHNHPFNDWSQKDFYQMAAFMGQVTYRKNDPRKSSKVKKLAQNQNMTMQEKKYLRDLVNEDARQIVDHPARKLRFPKDYNYVNAKPGAKVKAHWVMGDAIERDPGESDREYFARWMTHRENKRFAKTIANRLWKQVMGLALIEPVDDLSEENQALIPPLMDYLTTVMIECNFNLKRFLKVLCYTDAYQRAVAKEAPTLRNYEAHSGVLRRMTAEQIWDSYLTLYMDNVDSKKDQNNYKDEGDEMIMGFAVKNLSSNMSAQEMVVLAKELARRKENAAEMKRDVRRRRRGYRANVFRASEMLMPAGQGHFLSEFGQSDRVTLEAGNQEPSIPQVLMLLNSEITDRLTEEKSALHKTVAKGKSDMEKIDRLYMTVLTRYPTNRERQILLKTIRENRDQALADIMWALVNGREFMFIQ